jgi:molybdate/tungstate transport system permease protein
VGGASTEEPPALPRGLGSSLGLGVQLLLSVSLLLLLVLPLVALFAYVSPAAIGGAAVDRGLETSLAFTLLASALSLGIVLALGVPLGYLLARRSFPGRSVVESVVTLPTVLPHLIGGLAIFLLFAPETPLGRLAIAAGFPVFDTIWGVVLVMVYVSAAYTVLASQVAFESLDPQVLEAARSLGASPAEAFASVSLPLAVRGVLAGALLSWARAVSEIGGFLIVAYTIYPAAPYAGPVTSPISVYVYSLYQVGDLPGAVASSAFLVLVAFAIFLVVRLAARRGPGLWRRISLGR